MTVPAEVEKLCREYLEKVRSDPQHQLSYENRVELYLSFNFSLPVLPDYDKDGLKVTRKKYDKSVDALFNNFIRGDYALYWLGIITAEKAGHQTKLEQGLLRFEPKGKEKSVPIQPSAGMYKTLNMLQARGNDPVASDKMQEILDEYAWFYNEAALNVLDTVWGKTITGLEQVLGSKKLNDYTKPVEKACSLKNLTMESETYPDENSVENYDPQNRLKFWEWWLTEAIPEAWERAKNRPIGS